MDPLRRVDDCFQFFFTIHLQIASMNVNTRSNCKYMYILANIKSSDEFAVLCIKRENVYWIDKSFIDFIH